VVRRTDQEVNDLTKLRDRSAWELRSALMQLVTRPAKFALCAAVACVSDSVQKTSHGVGGLAVFLGQGSQCSSKQNTQLSVSAAFRDRPDHDLDIAAQQRKAIEKTAFGDSAEIAF
jgi:hypothetical protein